MWKDVNLNEKVVTYTSHKGAKTRTRKVPLNTEVLSILETWKKFTGGMGIYCDLDRGDIDVSY